MIPSKTNYLLFSLTLFLNTLFHTAISQSNSDLLQYEKFNGIASQFARQGIPDSALYYRKKARLYAKQPLQEIKVNLATAWDYFDKRQFDSATNQVSLNFEKQTNFFKTPELIRELALSYHFIKNIYNYRGDHIYDSLFLIQHSHFRSGNLL